MATKKLKVEITGNSRGLSSTLDSTQSRMGRFASSAGSWGSAVAGSVAAAFAVGKIVDFAGALQNLGTQVIVAGVKTDTVFQDSAGEVRAWSDQVNESMGLSDEIVAGMAANFGDLLKPMGFTSDQAADMSMNMLDLSGALSAWSGGTRSAAEVSEILSAAMLGETDSLKGLGISISAADVSARLAAKGQSELTGAALEQAEALAIQELIFEKSTDAQAAWSDGSMDAVKKQNELKAVWADLQVMFAEKLMPALQAGFGWLSDNVFPIVRHLMHVFDEEGLGGALNSAAGMLRLAWPSIRDALVEVGTNLLNWAGAQVQPILTKLGEWGQAFINWVLPQIPPLLEKLGALISQAGEWLVGPGLTMLWGKVQELAPVLWQWIQDTWPKLAEQMGVLWARAAEWLITDAVPMILAKVGEIEVALIGWIAREAPDAIRSAASGLWDGITDAFRSAINAIIDIWNRLEFTLPSISAFGRTIGGNTFRTPQIPHLASGGTARRSGLAMVGERGPELLHMPQGASVIPLNRAGGGGVNVFVTVQGSVHAARDLAEEIRSTLIRDAGRKGTTSIFGGVA